MLTLKHEKEGIFAGSQHCSSARQPVDTIPPGLILDTEKSENTMYLLDWNRMSQEEEEWPKAGSRVERLTLFSDAIFAFAMTLLAVDIRVPEIPQSLVNSELNAELANLAPKFIGFGLSFSFRAVTGYSITVSSLTSNVTTARWSG
jgi:hypothetical protein